MAWLIREETMRSSDGMTIGVLARKSGIAVRTLRFYEERGLIAPLGRTAKGYRLYGPNVVEDLTFLKGAKRLDLHLKEIRELLQIRRGGQCSCARTREFVESRLTDVESALGQLRALQGQLRQSLRTWKAQPNGGAQSPCRSIASEAHDGA